MEDKAKHENKSVAITIDDLRQILADQSKQNAETLQAVLEAVKKPTVIEQKKLNEEEKILAAKNEERKENSAAQLQIIQNKRAFQRIHTHKHRNGTSHCVGVKEGGEGVGYILCQFCQAKVRPGDTPRDYKGNDIYDTGLFNELFQTLPSQDMFQ